MKRIQLQQQQQQHIIVMIICVSFNTMSLSDFDCRLISLFMKIDYCPNRHFQPIHSPPVDSSWIVRLFRLICKHVSRADLFPSTTDPQLIKQLVTWNSAIREIYVDLYVCSRTYDDF